MADWLRTMDDEGVLCHVKVASLDRTYRTTRDMVNALSQEHPASAAKLGAVRDHVHLLYKEAHAHSAGVHLSHRRFVEIGTRHLPEWPRDAT